MAPVIPIFAYLMAVFMTLAVSIGMFAGIIILQIHLSQRESKWPGLILPAITLGLSLVPILGLVLFSIARPAPMSGTATIQRVPAYEITEIYCEVLRERQEFLQQMQVAEAQYMDIRHLQDTGRIRVSILPIFVIFIVSNVPTAILLLIYAAYRNSRKNHISANLNRMSLQDL